MSKTTQLTDITEDEEDQDLRDIIQNYIRKSEELEKRKSKVLQQVELVQSAVLSLQDLNRKVSSVTSRSVRIDVREIEEESKKIKEETERIQKEVKEKIEENKKLQDEIEKKKSLDSKKEGELEKWLRPQEKNRGIERKEIETRVTKTKEFPEDDSSPGICFFNPKGQKLRQVKTAQNEWKPDDRKEK